MTALAGGGRDENLSRREVGQDGVRTNVGTKLL